MGRAETSTGNGTTYLTQNPGAPVQEGAAGENPEAMMGGGKPLGIGGAEGGYGTAASAYSKRARYLDPFAVEEEEPQSPSVASVFEGATDRRGKPVAMSSYPTARTNRAATEQNERRARASTAKEKEDECPTPAQRRGPPGIE
jgi:hypothetical protein